MGIDSACFQSTTVQLTINIHVSCNTNVCVISEVTTTNLEQVLIEEVRKVLWQLFCLL
jgi:hypothetical protein